MRPLYHKRSPKSRLMDMGRMADSVALNTSENGAARTGDEDVQAFEDDKLVPHRRIPIPRRRLGVGQAEAGQEAEDGNAIELRYKGVKLGYVTRTENSQFALMIYFGHADAFEARVLQVDPEAEPWNQVRVGIYVTDKR